MSKKTFADIIGLTEKKTRWKPPELTWDKIMEIIVDAMDSIVNYEHLVVFQSEPYIDSIYVRFNFDWEIQEARRIIFHEKYDWDADDKSFFENQCLHNNVCTYSSADLAPIYDYYSGRYPEWNLQHYYTKGFRMLDHIYACMHKDGVKEVLYKAGLDSLAEHISEMDEFNLLASNPSNMYGDLSMRMLKALNCDAGAELLNIEACRQFVKNLNAVAPTMFKEKLNDAQCRYLKTVILRGATIQEVVRLFLKRSDTLALLWNDSMFNVFMDYDADWNKCLNDSQQLAEIDPIYAEYLDELDDFRVDERLKELYKVMVRCPGIYNGLMKTSNENRPTRWLEQTGEYIVRYPKDCNDFCREAIYMRNCMIYYLDEVMNNVTNILFLRRTDNADVPFITMEVYEDHLIQAFHRYNEDCTYEESQWIRAYCERKDIMIDEDVWGLRDKPLYNN